MRLWHILVPNVAKNSVFSHPALKYAAKNTAHLVLTHFLTVSNVAILQATLSLHMSVGAHTMNIGCTITMYTMSAIILQNVNITLALSYVSPQDTGLTTGVFVL